MGDPRNKKYRKLKQAGVRELKGRKMKPGDEKRLAELGVNYGQTIRESSGGDPGASGRAAAGNINSKSKSKREAAERKVKAMHSSTGFWESKHGGKLLKKEQRIQERQNKDLPTYRQKTGTIFKSSIQPGNDLNFKNNSADKWKKNFD